MEWDVPADDDHVKWEMWTSSEDWYVVFVIRHTHTHIHVTQIRQNTGTVPNSSLSLLVLQESLRTLQRLHLAIFTLTERDGDADHQTTQIYVQITVCWVENTAVTHHEVIMSRVI